MKNNVNKIKPVKLITLSSTMIACWAVAVAYSIFTIYTWGYAVDEYGLSGELGAKEILTVVLAVVLFVPAVWSFRLLAHSPSLDGFKSRHGLVVGVTIVGILALIPFVCLLLFLILQLLFVLPR